ncbi:hypothetical protein [Tetragenococcus solitarius]|uniref:3-dehydroquinate synthase domain-containing protein n=1 Tax=Tetragenococcus solitarius TaxID=71453 RepID=A0ABN3YAV2_9ENTE|nr:hypothetical protein [Tetragenococcus solitarius]
MQFTYQRQDLNTQITYGELLKKSIEQLLTTTDRHVIVLTNQRYYDQFFQKIQQAFCHHVVDWYIARNQLYCNHLEEMTEFLQFLGKFSPTEKYVFVAFGNEGVVQLTGFLQKTVLLSGEFWVIPTSLRSFFSALSENRTICNKPYKDLLQQRNLPSYIFLDQSIVFKQSDGKLIDLQMFIQAALVGDYSFLQRLFKNFPTKKQLQTTSFIAFIKEVTQLYESYALSITNYGSIFEKAFYLTENGHVLSSYMKRFLGMLLQLFWNLELNDSSFQIDNFMSWLKRLGYPIEFPKQLLIGEYLENVLRLQGENKLVVLSKIGKIGKSQSADEKTMIKAIDHYQKIISEI